MTKMGLSTFSIPPDWTMRPTSNYTHADKLRFKLYKCRTAQVKIQSDNQVSKKSTIGHFQQHKKFWMPKHKFRINKKEKRKMGNAVHSLQIRSRKQKWNEHLARVRSNCTMEFVGEEIILGGGRNRGDVALMVRMKPWMVIKAVANAVTI